MTTGDAGKVIGVPELPEHWNPPFLGSDLRKIRLSMSDKEWAFLAACVNAVYSPGGLKQQLSELQQRLELVKQQRSLAGLAIKDLQQRVRERDASKLTPNERNFTGGVNWSP